MIFLKSECIVSLIKFSSLFPKTAGTSFPPPKTALPIFPIKVEFSAYLNSISEVSNIPNPEPLFLYYTSLEFSLMVIPRGSLSTLLNPFIN
jgi:hypothetical protein